MISSYLATLPRQYNSHDSAWHKHEVFCSEDNVTVKRIREKDPWKGYQYENKLDEGNGTASLGIKADNEASINEILESRCSFFWRLDAIWGTRPNATPIVNIDTSKDQLLP